MHPDGSVYISKSYMEAYYIEKSSAVYEELQRALKLNAEGQDHDCISVLMNLSQQKRVHIQ